MTATDDQIQAADPATMDEVPNDFASLLALGNNPAFVNVTKDQLREWARKISPVAKLYDFLTADQIASLPEGFTNDDIDFDPFITEPTLEQVYELNAIVVNAQQYVLEGDSLGTRYDGPNGEMALRVSDGSGPPYFKIMNMDGSINTAFRATYVGEDGWTKMATP